MRTLLALISDRLHSEKFIRYTVGMATDLKYNLHLFYIPNPARYMLSSGTVSGTSHPLGYNLDVTGLEKERQEALKSIKENLANINDGLYEQINIEISAEAGTADMIINHLISDEKVDMVVLEGDEESDFMRLDTSGMGIINKINCPGWIIPFGSIYTQFKKIIYATDYNEADIQTLNRLIELTKDFSPEITALHITGSKDFEEKTMQLGFEEMLTMETNFDNISFKSIIDRGDKSFGEYINDTAVDIQADLIVLLKENKRFIEKIFKASSTAKIIKKARLPLLVFHENEKSP
jgi:nucleotide-binding universal stress UspA family protein